MATITKEQQLKQRVQRNILIGSALILVAKVIAYFVTNSVGILTDAMESIVNVLAGAISLYSIYIASKPKDSDHPYGHGKVELISASIEGILIIIAGVVIISKGVERILNPGDVEKLDIGIVIIALSGIANYFMGSYSVKIGKKYNSMALIADGKHLQSDSYSTVGLLVGLALLYFTHLAWIDSAIALIFGVIICVTGFSILRKTTNNLLDGADIDLLKDLADTMEEMRTDDWIDIHNTKVLKYGSSVHVDCDLTLPRFYTIEQGHQIGHDLQDALKKKYNDSVLLHVHLDPCNVFEYSKCSYCKCDTCPTRCEPFKESSPITVQSFVNDEIEDNNLHK